MRRRALLLATLVGPLLAPAAAHAQQVDEQLWLSASAATTVGRTSLTLESIGRFSDDAGGFHHAELGIAASREARPGVELVLGYRHIDEWDHGRPTAGEERLRQMVTVAIGHGFATRLRFEQRFHEGGGEVGLRLRPQLRFSRALTRGGVSLVAAHEGFIALNRTAWGQRGGYDRMRNSVGLSIPLGGSLKGDFGYLNQYRFGRDGARDRMDHIATVALNLSL